MAADRSRTLALASHFLIIERPARALDVLRAATPTEQAARRYWSLLAEAHYQQSQYEMAREAALAGLARHPEEIGLLRQLASACRQLKEYDAAAAALEHARNHQPDNANLIFDSAYLAVHAGDTDRADTLLLEGKRLAPDAQHVVRLQALIAHGRKRWAEAETHVRAWLADDADNSSAHFLLAEILARLNRELESKEALRRAAQLDATSAAAATLRRVERRQSGCIGAIFLLAIIGGALLGVVGLLAYLLDDAVYGLFGVAISLPLTGLLTYFLLANRRPATLQAQALVLGKGDRERRISYEEIETIRNGQLGIVIKTADKGHRLYRINHKEQAQLFVDLRNRVPGTQRQLALELQTPLPMTIWGNWHSMLAMVALFSVGAVMLYALYYNFAISGNRDWGITIFMGVNALFVALLAVWRASELPLYLRFSVEEIRIRYPIKTRYFAANQLLHVGLRRGYKIFKGRQLADYKIEFHFADGEVLRLGEGEIRHPPDDWSPLYTVAARLQVQYGVTAPRHEPGQIGRFIL